MDGFNNVYRGKTVLVTGHTGFKGSWLSIWLYELGANVVGFSLDPYTEKDNFLLSKIGDKIIDIRGDIRDKNKVDEIFMIYKPDFVFHLAAQSLVIASYKMPQETYEVNVMGTVNILEAIRKSSDSIVSIFVTTDKCYENKEQIWGYKESDSLGGYDPYSSSKSAVEMAISSWRFSFFNPQNYPSHGKSISSVRAGNVIGGGDWSIDRIVPDCIKSIEKSIPIKIRNPKSLRPWEFVLEPLSGYLLLGEKMFFNPVEYASAWNFGPETSSVIPVKSIADYIVKNYGAGEILDISNKSLENHESQILILDISKARFCLGWKPTLNIEESINLTVNWYKSYLTENVYEICVSQITDFMIKGGYI